MLVCLIQNPTPLPQFQPLNGKNTHYSKTLFTPFLHNDLAATLQNLHLKKRNNNNPKLLPPIKALFLEKPLLWAGRICLFYALLRIGLTGAHSGSWYSGVKAGGTDLGFSDWLEKFNGRPDDEAVTKRKLVSKWHPTIKGTLRRNYRVASKLAGRKLLKSIAALLSDDDHFIDASSHKGCQIRRESAHGETVCCNNVRALFDELPTPHLVVEITPFPSGPLTDRDYIKAEKLEMVLRTGTTI
ncbi:hypothetical protein QJS10_CPB12g01734 [Acorus calamus]|uniref:Uncharacterized protein n=1 Tax=Acorus calamus TaxID=4465 RepID=A0AAV9DJ21_ACOCL|nr:hypothetical protein QJS10_CPB12g01734 [Acorus calamus]